MKISKAITEIYREIERIQANLDSRDRENKLKAMELLGKREGLELAIEIIKNNM
jgi:hypothetical protein